MNEKLKILEMVQNGTISPHEGADLLKALEQPQTSHSIKAKDSKRRFLKIKVLSSGGDRVNVQIPLEFATLALRGTKKANILQLDKLERMNVDLDTDLIIQMIEDGIVGDIVDIEDADGDIVKIWIE